MISNYLLSLLITITKAILVGLILSIDPPRTPPVTMKFLFETIATDEKRGNFSKNFY
jgi:hypothetical protein